MCKPFLNSIKSSASNIFLLWILLKKERTQTDRKIPLRLPLPLQVYSSNKDSSNWATNPQKSIQRYYSTREETMKFISIDEVPPVGFDWVDDRRQISLAATSVFHQTVDTCHLLPANWAMKREHVTKWHCIRLRNSTIERIRLYFVGYIFHLPSFYCMCFVLPYIFHAVDFPWHVVLHSFLLSIIHLHSSWIQLA